MLKTSIVLLTVLVFAAAGCDTMGPKAKTGTVAGGVLGAAAGGIIGNQSRHRGLEGAAIGGALGALAGSMVGSAADQEQAMASTPPPPNMVVYQPEPLSVTQVAQMASQGTPDSVIISEIQRTHSVYHLNSEIITYLKNSKVSDRVIDYMMGTGS
jgi:hypothetical protein